MSKNLVMSPLASKCPVCMQKMDVFNYPWRCSSSTCTTPTTSHPEYLRVHVDILGGALDAFVNAARDAGYVVNAVEGVYPEISTDDDLPPGSFFALTTVRDAALLDPRWLAEPLDRFDVTHWTSTKSDGWRNRLLNPNPRFVPFGFLPCTRRNPVFVRPVSGRKLFAGFCYGGECGSLTLSAPLQTWCAVSRYRPVYSEWRFWVVDRKVVAGTKNGYVDADQPLNISYDHILAFAQEAALYSPVRTCVMDVVLDVVGHLWVVELNSVNCSGLYGLDPNEMLKVIDLVMKQERKNGCGKV